jgi:hypothetical protein
MDDMQLTPKERAILAGVLRDREYLAGLEWNPGGIARPQLGAYRVRIADAREGYVPMNLAGWIGHSPTPSEAVMYHRTYKRLAERGLLRRVSLYGDGSRTSHLQLTDRGEAVARNLCAMEARR